jgi:hypothetical protein
MTYHLFNWVIASGIYVLQFHSGWMKFVFDQWKLHKKQTKTLLRFGTLVGLYRNDVICLFLNTID